MIRRPPRSTRTDTLFPTTTLFRSDPGELIVTIENAAELQLQQPHVVRLETRPPNLEGSGEITMRDLVKNALRMRPDRIILGEVRGAEAVDMLQAMNTGHDGSLGTLHANRPREALTRLENMIRSEEHTSELQSLMRISYAVFCLKKKKNKQHRQHTSRN